MKAVSLRGGFLFVGGLGKEMDLKRGWHYDDLGVGIMFRDYFTYLLVSKYFGI
jgi:hypothetical protein